jgi:hypothetical protein
MRIAKLPMPGPRHLAVALAILAPGLFALDLFTASLSGAPPQPSPAVRAACSGDARRLCGAVIRDAEKRRACMVRHAAQLSAGCKTAVANQRRKGERAFEKASGQTVPSPAVRAACSGDARRLCGAVIRNAEKRRACMVGHAAQLSAGCKAAIAAQRKGAGGAAAEPVSDKPPITNAAPQ